MTLGYAELKKLIIDSVDRVQDGSDKTITGGRLNATRAADELEKLLAAKGAAPAATPAAQQPQAPQAPNATVPLPPPKPTNPLPGGSGGTTGGPVCGTSQLAGLSSATQSSTAGGSKANLAIDGECRKRRVWQGSCAQTREWGCGGQPGCRRGGEWKPGWQPCGCCRMASAPCSPAHSPCCWLNTSR